jgi:hypothetical protein
MSTTISGITSSSLLTSLVSSTEATTLTDSTDTASTSSSAATTDISTLLSAVQDSVSIMSRILGADNAESDSGDATYNVLLSAQSDRIMKTCPAFTQAVLSASESSGDDLGSINTITMDTSTLVSILQNS